MQLAHCGDAVNVVYVLHRKCMSLYCLISYLVVCHKKALFVCCAVNVIKASLFAVLTANSKKTAVKGFIRILSPRSALSVA